MYIYIYVYIYIYKYLYSHTHNNYVLYIGAYSHLKAPIFLYIFFSTV